MRPFEVSHFKIRGEMNVKEFSVKNFRSITDAYKLALGNYTVLVGPNNEGKSNVLRALVLGLNLLSRGRAVASHSRTRTRLTYRDVERFDYEWRRDFPLSLQDSRPSWKTVLSLTLELTSEDFEAFQAKIGSRLQSDLRIQLELGKEEATFNVVMRGRGKQYLQQREKLIAEFIGERLLVQYIPVSRSAEMSHDLVNELIQRELAVLETTVEYKNTLNQLESLQRPIREQLSSEISATMTGFIPNLKAIELVPDEYQLRHTLRSAYKLIVDDGVRTELAYKGDGIKSLSALSLIRHSTQRSLAGRHLILAVEEPETHLHPNAIHELRQVLADVAADQQVILTTHSPVLVDRVNVGNNIVVEAGNATKAKKLSDIRASLGVELSDNLAGAYLVLLVEGAEDARVIKKWLAGASAKLRSAMSNGTLVVEPTDGASKMTFKASLYRNLLCNVYAFLDNDQAGQAAAAAAIAKGYLGKAEYMLSSCPGMKESEFEDLIEPTTYRDAVLAEFGVNLDTKGMKGVNAKWSVRVEREFVAAGKLWRDEDRAQIKDLVATKAELAGVSALSDHRRACFELLVSNLEERIERRTAAVSSMIAAAVN